MIERLVWRGKDVLKRTEKEMGTHLDAVGVYLVGEVVKSFGSPQAVPEGGAFTATGKRMRAKRWRQVQHSAPGEPPFVQTGMLRRSIAFSRTGLELFLGSSLKPQGANGHSYAWWLEMGSGRMAARPYLRPAVRKNKATIMRMLKRAR